MLFLKLIQTTALNDIAVILGGTDGIQFQSDIELYTGKEGRIQGVGHRGYKEGKFAKILPISPFLGLFKLKMVKKRVPKVTYFYIFSQLTVGGPGAKKFLISEYIPAGIM